jgi:alkyl sulfatase BDS1-like metallo-beta-lactamase superfamily hydrolase
VIAERTPAANIRNWAITRARHLDGSFSMDRFMKHGFNPKFLSEASAVGLIHTLRVIVDPDKISGINHHIAFVIGDETAGLHIRNSVAVPTDGWGATTMVKMSRATLLTLLSERSTWGKELAEGAIVVSGDNAIVDRVRAAFENKGFAA